jgi:two-component sensor histidine kinase
MVFNFKVKSIPEFNKKLNKFLVFYILILAIITSVVLSIFFHSYDKNSYKITQNAINNKVSKFLSHYEYSIISIASQPMFRNLLGADSNIIQSISESNPFYYELKRQISTLTAKYKKNTIFEGVRIVNSDQKTILSQGLNSSPYTVRFKLCYRDSIVSYKRGTPCLGTWVFYINKDKLITNLRDHHIETTTSKQKNIPLQNLFVFDEMIMESSNLPTDIFFKTDAPSKYMKYYTSFIIFILFLSMIFLVKMILGVYKKNYLEFILKTHTHLTKNKLLISREYKDSPEEISKLVSAVNKAIKHRKAEAVESLAHDLRPPLKRLQNIAFKIENPIRQDILSIHTQCYIAINKLHNKNLENIDTKKSLHDCMSSIYLEQYKHGMISIEPTAGNVFLSASYSHFIRVISNLISNAIKATSDEKSPQINVRLSEESHLVKIEVQDNGKGMSSMQTKEIFKDGISFEKSTGKGLSYCKKTVASWGGEIRCDSEEGVGTTFLISLSKAKPPFDFINHIFYHQKSRFVLIDDEPSFHKYLEIKIPNDHEMVSIYNIDELKNFFELIPSKDDIFIIDYHFISDLNGIEIIKKYNLFGYAYIVSSSADFVKEVHTDDRKNIPMLSKEYLEHVTFSSLNKVNAVLVDDDTEILSDALEISKIKNVNLLTLNNFLQLKMAAPIMSKSIPITIDNNIDGINEKGIQVAKELHNAGHSELYLQTGENLMNKQFRFIKKILNKGVFHYG